MKKFQKEMVVKTLKRNAILERTLRDLYEPAKIAVNQIICTGSGDDHCQPCENRERLAIALFHTENVLKGE